MGETRICLSPCTLPLLAMTFSPRSSCSVRLILGPSSCSKGRQTAPHWTLTSMLPRPRHPGHSKSMVERVIQLVDAQSIDRVLGVLDRDWAGLLSPENPSPNVVYTDEYDLDATIMFAGDVLDRLISSVVDRAQCAAHTTGLGVEVRDMVIRVAGTIGVGRFVSIRDSADLRFDRRSNRRSALSRIDTNRPTPIVPATPMTISRTSTPRPVVCALRAIERQARDQPVEYISSEHDRCVEVVLVGVERRWRRVLRTASTRPIHVRRPSARCHGLRVHDWITRSTIDFEWAGSWVKAQNRCEGPVRRSLSTLRARGRPRIRRTDIRISAKTSSPVREACTG